MSDQFNQVISLKIEQKWFCVSDSLEITLLISLIKNRTNIFQGLEFKIFNDLNKLDS